MTSLPLKLSHVGVPPVKCQGIKTKLVPFILESVRWESGRDGRWIEPFVGSGVVALNLAPERALLADTNEHIIRLYQGISRGEISCSSVREFLEEQATLLERGGADHYYAVRDRFNMHGSPMDFIFLNRSCFNGVMRFNKKGRFNVPFGHKPERFRKAYITKIVNQIAWASRQMRGKDWDIRQEHWENILGAVRPSDFAYIDPPYIGRHTDYYNSWSDRDAQRLADVTQNLPCGFAVSMWLENRHRRNQHIDYCWRRTEMRICSHFYHVGSKEELRNEMDEALLVAPGYATPDEGKRTTRRPAGAIQLALLEV